MIDAGALRVEGTVKNGIEQFSQLRQEWVPLLASIEHGDGRAVVQLGKGFLREVLKSSTSLRTMPRRSNRRSSKGCSLVAFAVPLTWDLVLVRNAPQLLLGEHLDPL